MRPFEVVVGVVGQRVCGSGVYSVQVDRWAGHLLLDSSGPMGLFESAGRRMWEGWWRHVVCAVGQ